MGTFPGVPPQGQPPAPTFPAVYYSKKSVVPPLVIKDQAALDRLNAIQPNEWDTVPPTQDPVSTADAYPKLMFNVNLVPQIVNSADEETQLGGDWREYQFTQALVYAAQRQVQASVAKAAAKAAASQPAQPYPPGYYQPAAYGYPPQYPPQP